MKIGILALVVLLVGFSVGVATSVVRYKSDEQYGFSKPYTGQYVTREDVAPAVSPDPLLVPKVEIIGKDHHQFGVMMKNELRQCEFKIKNAGDAPLTIKFDSKSCQCTNVRVSLPVVPPGEISVIKMDWRPTRFDLNFSQSAIFITNDPRRREVQFDVSGRVQEIARAFPSHIRLNQISRHEAQTIDVAVFGYRDKDLKLEKIQVLNDELKSLFEFQTATLSESEVQSEPGAKSGVGLQLKLSPGFPTGDHFFRIRASTNKSDIPPLEITVEAKVEGDISIFGGRFFDKERQLFELGNLNGKELTEIPFWITVKGKDHDQVKFKVKSIDPEEVLSVELNESQPFGKRSRVQAKLVITPTNRFINRKGNKQGKVGKLVIETTHPEMKDLSLFVSFSVLAAK